MKYGFMKSDFLYKKCKVCHQEFNVSIKNKVKDKDYVCFDCEEKAKKYGNKPNVLLKNKNRFSA